MNAAFFVFAAAVLCVLYTLALYPVGLALYARSRKLSIRKVEIAVKVTVILPVRNGECWITNKLNSLLASEYPPELIQVIVVSDGSTDATASLVDDFQDDRIRLLPLAAGGKATAINRALDVADGDIVIFTDVRQTFDPLAVQKLVSCFGDSRVAVATGELVITKGSSSEESSTGLYWEYEKWIRRNLNSIDAMLGATGAIYAVRREIVYPIPNDTLLDDVYIPLAAAGKTHRIYFECEAKAYDLPTNLNSEFRRKVRTQAGVYQVMRRFPRLLWPGDRRGFHFLSHKVGRLFLPFAFLVMLLATPLLEPVPRFLAVVAQALFYGAALIDPLISERFPLKRLTSIARTFLVLVAAAFCATSVFVFPAQSLWKDTRATVPKSGSRGTAA